MRQFREFLQLVWKTVIDALFPAFCYGCKKEGCFLCDDCKTSIPTIKIQKCPWCLWPNGTGIPCAKCDRPERYLNGLIVMSQLEKGSLLHHCIHELKYEFIEELKYPLGNMLAETFLWQLAPVLPPDTEFCIVCPLPLHRKRLNWRGFNQSKLLCDGILAEAIATGHEKIIMMELLERVHFNRPQMELSRKERLENMEGAFRIINLKDFMLSLGIDSLSEHPESYPFSTEKILQFPVILVDDIATTLSTLNQAAKALKDAGFLHVYGLTLARVF